MWPCCRACSIPISSSKKVACDQQKMKNINFSCEQAGSAIQTNRHSQFKLGTLYLLVPLKWQSMATIRHFYSQALHSFICIVSQQLKWDLVQFLVIVGCVTLMPWINQRWASMCQKTVAAWKVLWVINIESFLFMTSVASHKLWR